MAFQILPKDPVKAVPVIQSQLRILTMAATPLISTRNQPHMPRSLQAQSGSLEALITWNSPANSSDIASWNIYKDNENNLIDSLPNPVTTQYRAKLPANTPTMFYISAVNAAGRESIKVGILAKANTDQGVVSGTSGGTNGTAAGLPPGYENEPTGGGGSRPGIRPTL
jgi:hypothetical protein